MRKLRLREAKKLAQGCGRKLPTRTCRENSLRACFIFLYVMLPSHRVRRLTLMVK